MSLQYDRPTILHFGKPPTEAARYPEALTALTRQTSAAKALKGPSLFICKKKDQ